MHIHNADFIHILHYNHGCDAKPLQWPKIMAHAQNDSIHSDHDSVIFLQP